MSQDQPEGGKLKLNLEAKEFRPKSFGQYQNNQMYNQNNQMYNQGTNPYMQYDMNQYGMYSNYMQPNYPQNYGNFQPNYPQGFQPGYQQNYQGNYAQNQYEMNNQNNFAEDANTGNNQNDGQIIGLGKKKNKKGKKFQNQEGQGQNTNQINQGNNYSNQGYGYNQAGYQAQQVANQFGQMNLGNDNNYNQNSINQPNKKENKKKDKKKEEPKKEVKKEQKKEVKKDETKKAEEPKPEEKLKLAQTGSKKIVEGDLVEDSFEGKMIHVDLDKKPMSLVFVGHVDSGKSTISGSLLYKLGQVDDRTIEKYKREAKIKNRESWFMAYIMDVNEEEREKGKTVEIGKATFSTPHRRITLLDAPGHSGYIPNLLQGACQADIAGLVISAKKGEFEAGFDKQGSTREHTLLLKALGVTKLIVIVNKMDEESVRWNKERYEFIKKNLEPFIKSCGYEENSVYWIPISGLTGDNLVKKLESKTCNWYEGPDLMELLDSMVIPDRDENSPVRLPILDRYKENYLYIMGKIETGTLKYGETYMLMPSRTKVAVDWLFNSEEKGVPYALPGENVRIRCKGIDNEDNVSRGNILCPLDDLCQIFNVFEAEIQVLELPPNLIIADGFISMLHLHTFIEECTISPKCEIDRKTKAETKTKFVRGHTRVKAFIKTKSILCGEKFEKVPSLGRFSLRYEGSTIAIGKILKIKPFKKDDKKN